MGLVAFKRIKTKTFKTNKDYYANNWENYYESYDMIANNRKIIMDGPYGIRSGSMAKVGR